MGGRGVLGSWSGRDDGEMELGGGVSGGEAR
jgi:hypothetical protein